MYNKGKGMNNKDEDMNTRDGRISLSSSTLKELRKKSGLSQEKLAEQCLKQGLLVSVSSIKRAELGMNVLYRTATHLAAFYGISVDDLLTDTTPVKASIKSPIKAFKTPSIFPYYKKSLLTIVLEIGAQPYKA